MVAIGWVLAERQRRQRHVRCCVVSSHSLNDVVSGSGPYRRSGPYTNQPSHLPAAAAATLCRLAAHHITSLHHSPRLARF